ncbi:MAG: helix-turn-helix domain-containing protein [Verrucomicrobia bacterium]|nr:helix-turn-helix domain-containing protein [Verrucomicrobiota bacterium]
MLTTNQLCERLQVSRATLWRWRLPCIHRGGVRRYQWGNVLAAIAQTAAKPAAGKARK